MSQQPESQPPPIPPPPPAPPPWRPPPRKPPDDPHRGARLILPKLVGGVTVGTFISAIVWFVSFGYSQSQTIMGVLLALLVIKYVVGFTALFLRDWRMAGLGIFISLPIGAVIFFGACAMRL